MAKASKEQSAKSWQARIKGGQDSLSASFVESLSYDRRIYAHDITGSQAQARMLFARGFLSARELRDILAGLEAIRRDIESGKFKFDEATEDIHMAVESALIARIGEAGRRLHTGRSRNDQVALDLCLWLDASSGEVASALHGLCKALMEMAGRTKDCVMPAYTHLQRAQPIDARAELLAWISFFHRDFRRFSGDLRARIMEESPLGSGAVAGTSLAIDSEQTRRELGFALAPISSIERTASRDLACEFLFGLSQAMMHLSRWAEQWIIYSSTEFSFLAMDDRHTTGSSMMPQKRNPDMLELIRGRCGCVYGDLVAMLTILKGLPLAYNRDLQEDKRILFRATDTTLACLEMATAIVKGSRFKSERIAATLGAGFLDATSLAEYMVSRGIPFRTAHQVVGALVLRCEQEGHASMVELGLAGMQEVARERTGKSVFGPDVLACLGAANVVRRYRSAGAAGGKPLEKSLKLWARRLADARP